jgi:predicted acylesterase/phospholipase RssA
MTKARLVDVSRKRRSRASFLSWLVWALLLSGCATAQVYEVARATSDTPCRVPMPERDVVVGVALSGGGSRAALFGASGLEALSDLRTSAGSSLLEQVTLLSSVSGGSLAASYYALNKPPRDVPVLTPEGGLSEPYRAFFDQYRAKLSQDFESALIWRQLGSFRWLNSSLAANSLAEILSERLLGDVTQLDLSRRQAAGDAPGLVVNTTLYNNGRRLAMTSLPASAFSYDFTQALQESLARQGRHVEIPPSLIKRWELLRPMTPLEINMDPCPIRLVGMVTASASFPPLVGPITMQIRGEETYWHVGDGGLYENQGIESLLFVFLNQLQEKKARRALILAFDSSFPFSVGDRQLSRRAQPFSLLTFDFSRIPSIMEERATTYQALFFSALQIEEVFPGRETARVIVLRHIDAEWREDLADLPAACRGERPPLQSPTAVVERIAQIPTSFNIASECDRQLLATAATKLVAQHRTEILEFLEGRPPAVPVR